LPAERLFFGEIALSGAVRPVIHAGARLKEAGKLGFRRAVLPQAQQTSEDDKASGVALSHCGHVASLVADIAKDSVGTRERGRPQRQS
jgi:DNA repair protein RadA/Sms